MIVRRFLLWARSAPPGDRAEAIGALARAYLYSGLSPDDRWEAETALTAMLEDRSALVRRAMAENLATSPDAPRHVIVALASDQIDVASIVLAASPVLLDCDLVDAAALGDERVQCAIAARPWLSHSLSAALAEVGTPTAVATLARNPGADITHATLSRMVERFGEVADVREALIGRPDLPVDIAQAIAAALARTLESFVAGCGWLSAERSGRIVREARDRTTVALSARSGDEIGRLVSHLRRSGQLTPALMLRALLSREIAFVEAAFADLAQLRPARVCAILADRRGQGFRALYARAGLPAGLRPAFEAALAAFAEGAGEDVSGAQLSRRMIQRALSACESLPEEEAGRLLALLRRFEVEAALDEARGIADGLADEAALAIVLEHHPDALRLLAPSSRALAA